MVSRPRWLISRVTIRVKSIARCRSANEMADALASGSCICISDSQGFALTRDRDGFLSTARHLVHYHVFAGLVVQLMVGVALRMCRVGPELAGRPAS